MENFKQNLQSEDGMKEMAHMRENVFSIIDDETIAGPEHLIGIDIESNKKKPTEKLEDRLSIITAYIDAKRAMQYQYSDIQRMQKEDFTIPSDIYKEKYEGMIKAQKIISEFEGGNDPEEVFKKAKKRQEELRNVIAAVSYREITFKELPNEN